MQVLCVGVDPGRLALGHLVGSVRPDVVVGRHGLLQRLAESVGVGRSVDKSCPRRVDRPRDHARSRDSVDNAVTTYSAALTISGDWSADDAAAEGIEQPAWPYE